MMTANNPLAPAKPSSADEKIDAGLERVQQDFGADLESFFAAVIADVTLQRQNRAEEQDPRFIKARESQP